MSPATSTVRIAPRRMVDELDQERDRATGSNPPGAPEGSPVQTAGGLYRCDERSLGPTGMLHQPLQIDELVTVAANPAMGLG